MPNTSDEFAILGADSPFGLFDNIASGQRLTTVDGDGSFVVNYGLGSVYDASQIVLSDFLRIGGLLGDFDNNGLLDAADNDLLSVALGSNDSSYGLNSDGQITGDDRVVWVEDLKGTYHGDANLDGEFSSCDFVQVFERAEYEDSIFCNSGWADDDWNGDGEFDSSDFVLAFQSGGRLPHATLILQMLKRLFT